MCFIRKALDWVFTQTELKWLDDIMPELHKREKEDKTKEIELQHKQEEVYCKFLQNVGTRQGGWVYIHVSSPVSALALGSAAASILVAVSFPL